MANNLNDSGVELVNGIDAIIEVKGLEKSFGDVRAVAGVDFMVKRGEIFGFLGPNGAGKTTTINMLTGLARPDSGSIRIDGCDCIARPRSAQGLIGVVPDESNLYPELTGRENLCFCGALYGLSRAGREERAAGLLDSFGLGDAADRKFTGYSRGMKRKLTIAAGIIHRPGILFLDEPTTGIDVASARQLRQLVAGLNHEGTTIFLTTHYIEEAERLCSRIAFIVAGRIAHQDTVEGLLQPVRDRHGLRLVCNGLPAGIAEQLVGAFAGYEFAVQGPETIKVEAGHPLTVGPLVRRLEELGVEVVEAARIHPSLEDVFIRITGLEAKVMQNGKGGAR